LEKKKEKEEEGPADEANHGVRRLGFSRNAHFWKKEEKEKEERGAGETLRGMRRDTCRLCETRCRRISRLHLSKRFKRKEKRKEGRGGKKRGKRKSAAAGDQLPAGLFLTPPAIFSRTKRKKEKKKKKEKKEQVKDGPTRCSVSPIYQFPLHT